MEPLQIKKLLELKEIIRQRSAASPRESVAAHTWGCLLIASLMLKDSQLDVDEKRIYEHLIYHDIVEIEAGDVPLSNTKARIGKKEKEEASQRKICEWMSRESRKFYDELYEEYESKRTTEARYAKAIDAVEILIQSLKPEYKWSANGYTEDFIREHKQKLYDEFPQLKTLFEDTIQEAKRIGCLPKT